MSTSFRLQKHVHFRAATSTTRPKRDGKRAYRMSRAGQERHEKGDCDSDRDRDRRIGGLRPQRPQRSQPRRRIIEGSGKDPAAAAAATVVAAAATAAASTAAAVVAAATAAASTAAAVVASTEAEVPETPASVALAAASALHTGDADTIISKRGRKGREFEASRLLLTD